ncbi:MAG: DUF4423 domain-containing protein, partial [Bdellovibrionaceae bacterium]|nr:DUF4423 domain-containing protein [Pseudobdellovibrionaceae bacterium]
MSTQIGVSRLLQSKFISGKQKNDKFSLRAFAQKLKLSPGTLSQILNGKRKISHKKAREICELLELSPIEREQFLKDFNVKAAPEVKTVFLSDDKFQVIAEWYYLAILALSETIDFKFNTDWISSRLNLEKNIVIEAIKKLLELKLLAFDEDG